MYRYDASYALEVRARHPDRFAVIKPVDPDDPKVGETIADWTKTPGTVGIRIMMNRGRLDAIRPTPASTACWPRRRGTTCRSTCCARGRLEQIGPLAKRNPDTRTRHRPPRARSSRSSRRAPAEPWAELPKLLALAPYKNVVVKISGACTLSHENRSPTRTSGSRSAASSTRSASIAACGAPTGRAPSRC